MYAKLENNKLIYAPRNYNTGTGLIVNFNKNIKLIKKYGFKEVIDNKPAYDNTAQYLAIKGYEENEDSITINYEINKIKTNNEPTLEDKIVELEKANKEQDELINTIMLATDQMYMMLEPLLSDMFIEGEVVNPLVNIYAAMIKKGLIDQVPEKYRDLVNKNIEIL